MVTGPCTKDPVTAEVDNVASRGIIRFPQKSSESVLRPRGIIRFPQKSSESVLRQIT
jgi:hypothetical protein